MENQKEVVLEPSTNTHKMRANDINCEQLPDVGGMKMVVNGPGLVMHGEHNVICTEETHVVKTVQQETNPVTGMMQNSYD